MFDTMHPLAGSSGSPGPALRASRLKASACLCAAACLLAGPVAAQGTPSAEAAPAEPIRLQAITVTGARAPKALSDLPSSVSIVEQQEVQDQLELRTNILGALDVLVPGLTVSQGEFRSGCRTNIRGRPAQFLINGVPTNDNLRRSNCGSLFGISPFAIERIEVLRGSTALFGAGAPGGVINLLTRRAESEALEVDAAAQWSVNPHETQDSSEYTVYTGAGQKRDGWDYYVGGALQEYGTRHDPRGGLVPGSEFRAHSLNASVGADVGPGQLRFTGVYNREDPNKVYSTDGTQVAGQRFATVSEVDPANPFVGEASTEQTVLALSYDLPSVLGHMLSFSVFRHEETLIQRSADVFEGEVFNTNSDADNERLGLRSTANRQFQLGRNELDLTYGLDFLRQSYYRPLVDPATDEITGYISPEVVLRSTAVFVQPQFRTGPWLFSGGVRHEQFRGQVTSRGFDASLPNASTPGDTPDFSLTLYNLGVVYDLTSTLQLFGGFSQGAEISEFGRAARGIEDPSLINLEAAKSDQIELGVRGRRGPVDFSFAVFRSKSDKAANLQADPRCAGEPICPLIPLRLGQKLYGFELTADWKVNRQLALGTLVTFQKGRFTEPGASSVPFGADTVSPPRATVYAEFEPVAGWKSRLQATQFGETDEYDDEQEAAGFRNTDSVFLMDFSTSYRLGPGRLSLGIANLLNRRYVNVTNQASGDFFYYLSEGRRATLTYQARF